jgi:hypothetical protein
LASQELVAITAAGRIVSAGEAGGVATMSTTSAATNGAFRLNDLWMDPGASANSTLASTNAAAAGEWMRVCWYPQVVAQLIVVNRGDNQNVRYMQGDAVARLIAQNGTIVASRLLGADFVQVINVAPLAPAPTPDPTAAAQTDETNRSNRPRYIRISGPAGASFSIREVWVLDSTTTNVAQGKPAVVVDAGSGAATASHGTDGVFDYDVQTLTSNGVRLNGTGTATSYTIDLGGLYFDIQRVQVWFNRFALPPASGVRIEALNWYGW